jgi:hypothetical protein
MYERRSADPFALYVSIEGAASLRPSNSWKEDYDVVYNPEVLILSRLVKIPEGECPIVGRLHAAIFDA